MFRHWNELKALILFTVKPVSHLIDNTTTLINHLLLYTFMLCVYVKRRWARQLKWGQLNVFICWHEWLWTETDAADSAIQSICSSISFELVIRGTSAQQQQHSAICMHACRAINLGMSYQPVGIRFTTRLIFQFAKCVNMGMELKNCAMSGCLNWERNKLVGPCMIVNSKLCRHTVAVSSTVQLIMYAIPHYIFTHVVHTGKQTDRQTPGWVCDELLPI